MAQASFTAETFVFPAWAAEELRPERLITGGRLTASAFPFLNQVTVTVGAAGAAVDATTVPIDALAVDNELSKLGGVVIPSGATLDFGGDKFATLTADASVGDTSLTVRALVTALADNDTAIYQGMVNRKPVPSGILVGRTYAERGSNVGFGQPDVATPDDELFLIAFDVEDALINPDFVMLRHRTKIYEDLLPGWSNLGTAEQAAIRERYDCIISAR